MQVIGCLLLLLLTTATAVPYVNWRTQLPGSGTLAGRSLRQNNGIVQGVDGRLWVTTDDGTVFILDPITGDVLSEIIPPTRSSRRLVIDAGNTTNSTDPVEIEVNYFTSSQSKMNLYEGAKSTTYGVYSLIDTADDSMHYENLKFKYNLDSYDVDLRNSTYGGHLSRVVALNGDGSTRWIYEFEGDKNGWVIGSPQIGVDGRYIYLTFNNYINQDKYKDHDMLGSFVVLEDGGNGVVSLRKHLTFDDALGPVKIVSPSGEGDNVLFSTFGHYGYAENGKVYRFINRNIKFTILEEIVDGSSAAVPPVVDANFTHVWVAGTSSTVKAFESPSWANLTQGELVWDEAFSPSRRNESAPILNAPLVTSDMKYMFLISASTDIHCVNPLTGEEYWDYDQKSVTLAAPKLNEVEDTLYSIFQRKGTVLSIDAVSENFEENWSFESLTCDSDDEQICEDSVEADFEVAGHGYNLFYGTIFGEVISLQVTATSVPSIMPTKSDHPSAIPTTSYIPTSPPSVLPTAMPSSLPTLSPTLSIEPSSLPTSSVNPSQIPSTLHPTDIPSDIPSTVPTSSFEPSISEVPSLKPSQSVKPSNKPSRSFIPTISPTYIVTDQSKTPPTPTSASQPIFSTFILISCVILCFVFCL